MSKPPSFWPAVVVVAFAVGALAAAQTPAAPAQGTPATPAQGTPAPGERGQGGAGRGPALPAAAYMTITSPAFADAAKIPDKFGCSASPTNVSPVLQWSDAPAGTVTFALVMHDLDPRPARSVEDFLHWMVWNIPATTTQLKEGASAIAEAPDGTRQIITASRVGGPAIGYRSPCPPAGPAHHYVFDIFALDTKLQIAANGNRADVMKAMEGHVLGHGVLVGLFSK